MRGQFVLVGVVVALGVLTLFVPGFVAKTVLLVGLALVLLVSAVARGPGR